MVFRVLYDLFHFKVPSSGKSISGFSQSWICSQCLIDPLVDKVPILYLLKTSENQNCLQMNSTIKAVTAIRVIESQSPRLNPFKSYGRLVTNVYCSKQLPSKLAIIAWVSYSIWNFKGNVKNNWVYENLNLETKYDVFLTQNSAVRNGRYDSVWLICRII